jgi:hypothetical protein
LTSFLKHIVRNKYGFVLNIILEIKLQPDDTHGNMQLPWQQGKLQSNGNVFSPLKFHIFIIFSSSAWPFDCRANYVWGYSIMIPHFLSSALQNL